MRTTSVSKVGSVWAMHWHIACSTRLMNSPCREPEKSTVISSRCSAKARNISRASHSVRSLTSLAVRRGRLSTTACTISSSMALASA